MLLRGRRLLLQRSRALPKEGEGHGHASTIRDVALLGQQATNSGHVHNRELHISTLRHVGHSVRVFEGQLCHVNCARFPGPPHCLYAFKGGHGAHAFDPWWLVATARSQGIQKEQLEVA
eukprot:12187176-Alexandrium_andersonii.AAC.1